MAINIPIKPSPEGVYTFSSSQLAEYVRVNVEAEREACAQLVCDERIISDPSDQAEAAAAIRARSEQGKEER